MGWARCTTVGAGCPNARAEHASANTADAIESRGRMERRTGPPRGARLRSSGRVSVIRLCRTPRARPGICNVGCRRGTGVTRERRSY
jgi:hypothetical protein